MYHGCVDFFLCAAGCCATDPHLIHLFGGRANQRIKRDTRCKDLKFADECAISAVKCYSASTFSLQTPWSSSEK